MPELLPAINAHLKCGNPSAETFKMLFIILYSPQIVLKQMRKSLCPQALEKGIQELGIKSLESLSNGHWNNHLLNHLFGRWHFFHCLSQTHLLSLMQLFPFLACQQFLGMGTECQGKKGNLLQPHTRLRRSRLVNGWVCVAAQPCQVQVRWHFCSVGSGLVELRAVPYTAPVTPT